MNQSPHGERLGRRTLLRGLPSVAVALLAWPLANCGRAGAPLTPKVVRLPDYAYRSQPIQVGYRFAVDRPELLAQLPCYCGCAQLARPHTSLRDCFLNPAGGFDSHASGCSTCIDETLDARRLLAEGRAPAEIRAAIDETYRSRGRGTDTPPVLG